MVNNIYLTGNIDLLWVVVLWGFDSVFGVFPMLLLYIWTYAYIFLWKPQTVFPVFTPKFIVKFVPSRFVFFLSNISSTHQPHTTINSNKDRQNNVQNEKETTLRTTSDCDWLTELNRKDHSWNCYRVLDGHWKWIENRKKTYELNLHQMDRNHLPFHSVYG